MKARVKLIGNLSDLGAFLVSRLECSHAERGGVRNGDLKWSWQNGVSVSGPATQMLRHSWASIIYDYYDLLTPIMWFSLPFDPLHLFLQSLTPLLTTINLFSVSCFLFVYFVLFRFYIQGTLKIILHIETLAKIMVTFKSHYFGTWRVSK